MYNSLNTVTNTKNITNSTVNRVFDLPNALLS